jgi:membrane protein implicated in regulation of membrane protease activity
MNIVRRTERMLNIAYVIWVASIAAIVATSSMLLFNATYFAFLVFFPSIAFGLRKRYALATFIFFLMLS